MALLLVTRRGSFYYKKGIPSIIRTLQKQKDGVILEKNRKDQLFLTSLAGFRTSGFGNFEPHESPQVRQSSTSLNLGVVNRETSADEEQEEDTTQEGSGSALLEKGLLKSLAITTKFYDFLTLPIYAAIQQPWKKLALHNSVKAVLVNKEKMIYKSIIPSSPLHEELDQAGVTTMARLFDRAVEVNANSECLGTRPILSEEDVQDPHTGKILRKLELGDYRWKTYAQVGDTVEALSSGLATLNLGPKERVAIFAETREEWFITAMAAFKRNLPIVTVFTTLTDDGVIHALQETAVSTIFTSEDLMPRCRDLLRSLPKIQNVVYMEKPIGSESTSSTSQSDEFDNVPSHVRLYKYSQLVDEGFKVNAFSNNNVPVLENIPPPEPEDVAIIMYTSGSTGVPKGVMLSHGNMIAGLKSSMDITDLVGDLEADDKYAAYLPLAHAMELMCEAISFSKGVPIGYSSPLTLTDKSLGIKAGSKGDATILKPSVMPTVPLVVERICKGIKDKVAESGKIAQLLFYFFYEYKVRWKKLGYETPIVDKIFFSKIRALTGGRLRYMVVGGAPLAPQTQEFIRTVLCCPVAVGYGMTESGATGCLTLSYDLSIGRAGVPLKCSQFRLVDWKEGGYRVTDKPYPRGEVYIGGDNVALGYFNKDGPTDFFQEDGVRWIKTGDIAEVHPDGAFVIIDRKKDLVKLSTGKYVSLGKIESVLKVSPYVENICVYADPSKEYTVALIVPSQAHLEQLANSLELPTHDYGDLCSRPVIEETILADIQKQGKLLNLVNNEIPKKIRLCPTPWVPASGLVTAAFKIKRNNIYKEFQSEIFRMYASSS